MSTEKEQQLLDIADNAVSSAIKQGANVAEAVLGSGSHLSVKIRKGAPELVEEAGSRGLGLRVIVDGRVALVSTNDLSKAGIDTIVSKAIELAKLSQKDEFAGPPDPALLSRPSEHKDLKLFDPKVPEVDGAHALEQAGIAEAAALAADKRITNSDGANYSRTDGQKVVVTSGGFRGATRGTYASLSVHPIADDEDGKKRSGYYWSAKRFLSKLEAADAVGKEAAKRTLAKLGAKKVPSAEVPVIFDPDVARSLLGMLASVINGGSIWRKSSYLMDRLGTQVASNLVSIVDDPLIEEGPGSRAFDGEGLLSRKNSVVENGILKTFILDTYSAKKLGMQSTASASRGGSGGVSPSVSNFILEPGKTSPEDILKSTPNGLYVTDMMGFGFNAVTGDFSRGASGFWIEKGELTYPVAEVTLSLNFDELLKRIDAVGNDLDMRSAIASPTFRVSSMTLAGS